MLMKEIPAHFRDRRFASAQDRREFLKLMGLGGLFFMARGAFAQALTLTPEQTIGPYYPDHLPLDLDNDLLLINDAITPAVGAIAWVSGKVLDKNGAPLRGALVEIWQADNNGAYIHSASPRTNRDAGFQGYGKFLTGSSGEYLFRTVKPGLYPGRTRHIHFQVTPAGSSAFTTQLYVDGEPLNGSDGVLNGIRDAAQRASVIAPFAEVAGSSIGELAAKFDIVMNYTPSENPAPSRPTLVAVGGVTDAASSYPGVAAGSWVTLFGEGLADTTRNWDATDTVDGALPQSLDGVSVRINDKPAVVSYVSPKQINALAPVEVAIGAVPVTVSNAGGTSDPVMADAAQFRPAFYPLAQEYVSALRSDGAPIGPPGLVDGVATTPANPGDRITLLGSGFGPADPDGAVTIRIDTQAATVSAAKLASPGMYQIEITVPDLPDGDYAVTAEIAGARTQKIGRLRIARR